MCARNSSEPRYRGWGVDTSAAAVQQSTAHVDDSLLAASPSMHALGGFCEGSMIAGYVAGRAGKGSQALALYLNFCGPPWERLPAGLRLLAPGGIPVPSAVHLLGDRDELFSASELSSLPAQCSGDSCIIRHPQGHVVPLLTADLRGRLHDGLGRAARHVGGLPHAERIASSHMIQIDEVQASRNMQTDGIQDGPPGEG